MPRQIFSQATAVNGSIQGTISDPTGAVLPNAVVKIVSSDTGAVKTVQTDAAGYYASGPLIPGNYVIDVTSPGFAEVKSRTIVQIGVATSGSLRLPVVKGKEEIVEVNAGAVQVNTEQSSVADVLTTDQIESLPVNGRNFLDLAQLEPGVQLQSGQDFDPTKAGYSAISFSGVSGRTTRILLDGQDITDETVGTTILNVSEGAIDQFQMNRSNADVSGEIGSGGHVMVSTRSGTNSIHGELFGNFQDARAGFASSQGITPPFQRDHFGGSVGGPILRDKLFLFANAERIKQTESSAVQLLSPFDAIAAAYPTIPSPYKLTYSTGRMDYNGSWGVHYFARVAYDVDSIVSNFGDAYANYANRDNTPAIAGGADFATGKFTHSVRTSYEKFHNMIADASGSGVYLAKPGILIRYAAAGFYTGPNDNAPQATYQSEKQLRYDGSWTHSVHNVRYGISFNRILQGGFASFFGLGPRVSLNSRDRIGAEAITPTNLLQDFNLLYSGVRFGNGLGYYTNEPQFGQPAGGMDDYRLGLYVADSWKISPRLTLNAGLSYRRDTGRTDHDMAPITCSEINTSIFPNPPCSGSSLLLDQFDAGLGKQIPQPNFDFAPQVGFAYSVDPQGKTVVRGAVGLFRESNVFNAVQFDIPFKLKSGLFNDYSHVLCSGNYSFAMPGKGAITSWNGESFQSICAEPLSTSADKFIALQKAYQAASKAAGPAGNGSFIGNRLAIPDGNSAYSPTYKTPYSFQFNIGAQRQITSNAVLSLDYVHQLTQRIAQQIDANYVGAAKYYNKKAAAGAVAATVAACQVATLDAALNKCPGLETHSDGTVGPATIGDFSSNGLDSGNVVLSGYPASYYGATPDQGAAFPGRNANVGNGFVTYPEGRSVYDGLQVTYHQQKDRPAPGLKQFDIDISYALSSFKSTSNGGSDQFFVGSAYDYNHPGSYMGWGGMDHRHNLSFGGWSTFIGGAKLGMIGHLRSSGALNAALDTQSSGGGQIFLTDVTGDGTVGDLMPGTKPGAWGRTLNGGNLTSKINEYNSKYAGQLTPAGQQVVSSGVMTMAQIAKAGGVQQPIAVPSGPVYENPIFRAVDLSLSYPAKLKFISESFSIEPEIAFYNAFNMGNFNRTTGTLLNTSDAGLPNFINGYYDHNIENANRIGRGAGTFDQGDARSIEFQLRIHY